ncbi:hypothetical protein BMETH_32251622642232, partial [methanotrophic bacterial endosymbiont of Bathymodiolus sp.]
MSAQALTAIGERPEQLLFDELNTLLSKYLDASHL